MEFKSAEHELTANILSNTRFVSVKYRIIMKSRLADFAFEAKFFEC